MYFCNFLKLPKHQIFCKYSPNLTSFIRSGKYFTVHPEYAPFHLAEEGHRTNL